MCGVPPIVDTQGDPKEGGPWKAEKSGEEALDGIKTAAQKVEKQINDLPAADQVTTDNKGAIESARKAFDELTNKQKEGVPEDAKRKLDNDEVALAASSSGTTPSVPLSHYICVCASPGRKPAWLRIRDNHWD